MADLSLHEDSAAMRDVAGSAGIAPVISIVIPSHNRQDLLERVLDALAAQDEGTPAFEVVIVLDGCRDGSPEMLAARSDPFAVRSLRLPGVGPSMARNAGVAETRADLLVFIDDDVIPTSGLVAAHAAAHAKLPGAVVIGPYPPEPIASGQRFRQVSRDWWEEHFNDLAKPGARITYQDLLTGNLSMTRALWDAVGGLDPQFSRAREDWELGYRLMEHGAHFVYAPEALGWHQEHLTATEGTSLKRAREEGRSDALMAIKHPRLARSHSVPRQMRKGGLVNRLRAAILPRAKLLEKPVMAAGPGLLTLLEKAGLLGLRTKVRHQMILFCYQRGSLEVLGRDVATFGTGDVVPQSDAPLEIDIAKGMDQAEAVLAQHRPQALRLRYGDEVLADLAFTSAAEAWNAQHLRALLMRPGIARKLAPILAAQRFGGTAEEWRKRESMRLIGVPDFLAQLHEGQRQWRRSLDQ